MPKINVLDKSVYELIAAGEVIERPASVVKELLENAIDAGGDSLTVEIKNGGRTFIRVADNGCGIPHDELSVAFMRHATSKVSDKDDLDRIVTLGFRGEALASVCAVSKVSVFTRTADSSIGSRYMINGGEEIQKDTAGCPVGTTVMVRDLFYNVPARLKFLKKDATEANRIAELVGRIAVSYPERSFRFIKDNKTVFVTAGDGKLYSAVYCVFGRDFASSLIPVDYRADGVSVEGFVSQPLKSRNNRKLQTFYVNGRYVRSEVCSQAIEEAYRNMIMTGKFPACVLKLTISPGLTDVNVHPAKTEIRFSDNKLIYDAVYFSVKDALSERDKPVKLDISKPVYYDKDSLYEPPQEPAHEQLSFHREESAFRRETESGRFQTGDDRFLQSLMSEPDEKPPHPWKGILQPVGNQSDGFAAVGFAELQKDSERRIEAGGSPDREETARFGTNCGERAEPGGNKEEDPLENFRFVSSKDFEKKLRQPEHSADGNESDIVRRPSVIGEVFKTYIIAQCGDLMLMIDKHAAHERYLFEQIKNDCRNISSQLLLEPVMVTLPYDEYDVLSANTEKLGDLGFTVEPDVAPTVAVKGLPMVLRDENPEDIICEIAHKLILNERDPSPELYDDLMHTMACKAAIKANDDTPPEELQKLVDMIYGREDIRYCPHGRPVMTTLTKKDIEKQFRRIV